MASRASSGGVSASSTPTASSPQDDTVDGDDISWASSHIPSLAPDSPIARPHNTIEIQVCFTNFGIGKINDSVIVFYQFL